MWLQPNGQINQGSKSPPKGNKWGYNVTVFEECIVNTWKQKEAIHLLQTCKRYR